MNILYVPLRVVWAMGGLSQELCSTQKSNWWAAQWPVRSSLPSDIEGDVPGECVDDMVALRNRDGRLFGRQDRRKPEQGAASDMSFEEHLSVVGPQPTVSRETVLLLVDLSPTCSLFAPLQSTAESPFY